PGARLSRAAQELVCLKATDFAEVPDALDLVGREDGKCLIEPGRQVGLSVFARHGQPRARSVAAPWAGPASTLPAGGAGAIRCPAAGPCWGFHRRGGSSSGARSSIARWGG